MNITHVYIVRRESADGLENDVFLDRALAERWASCIGSEVEEEGVLGEHDVTLMTNTFEER